MTDLLKRFADYHRPHRGLFVLDFSSAMAVGLLELAFPVAVTLFIDKLLPTGQFGLIALATIGLLHQLDVMTIVRALAVKDGLSSWFWTT